MQIGATLWRLGIGLGLVATLGATAANAYFLDKARNFDVRARAYTQLGVMTQDSPAQGFERNFYNYQAFDLAQWRNFYNPELDAKLVDYTRWMGNVPGLSAVGPDEFNFRFAWWGFYDGVYDSMNPGWNDNRRALKGRYSQTDDPYGESFSFSDENKNPRHIYGTRNRINELYLEYTKNRLFVRAGRQAISWGEADTIALLDVSNPFDLTMGAPGFFQDVEEARIPLWTLRGTYKLIDNWKWLSSFFVDSYLVPGKIDTTVPINPITGGVTPFGPDQGDVLKQLKLWNETNGDLVINPIPFQHLVLADRLPEKSWHNSRWGVRLTGVVLRDYTVQTWFFRTFNQQPVPHLLVPPADLPVVQVDNRGFKTPVCNGIPPGGGFGRTPAGRPCKRAVASVNVLERDLESVFGVAATWFSQPVNGIIRTEMEYFMKELAFLPQQNLNPRTQIPRDALALVGDTRRFTTSVPKADYLRFLVGYDRFFFFRLLNPSNSFTLSTAFNGSLNLSERSDRDFRFPNPKRNSPAIARAPVEPRPIRDVPGCQGPQAYGNPLCVKITPKNFEDAQKFEGFLQTAFITDYFHGRLSPRLVIITDISGIFGIVPSATWRFSDSFLASATYLAVVTTDRKVLFGTFEGRDMIQLRLTYQLN